MGLLTFIQIPCRYVLANEISLNLKYRIGLKHFFNINLGIGIIKKTTFFICIFEISLVFLLKFRSGELVGCGIKFHIQQVPTLHTFDGPCYPKINKYLKKCDDDIIIMFFQVFLIFWVARPIKSMSSGNISKHRDICQKYQQKSSFFMIPIPKFILKICLRGALFSNFKAF